MLGTSGPSNQYLLLYTTDHQKVEVEEEINQTESQSNKYNWHCLQCPNSSLLFFFTIHATQISHKCFFCSIHALQGIVHTIIIWYLPSCHFKPVFICIFCRTRKEIFEQHWGPTTSDPRNFYHLDKRCIFSKYHVSQVKKKIKQVRLKRQFSIMGELSLQCLNVHVFYFTFVIINALDKFLTLRIALETSIHIPVTASTKTTNNFCSASRKIMKP